MTGDRSDKITIFSSAGSIVAGILASICCIGPLVFVVLGLSGAAFFVEFEQYRLIFGIFAIGFLSLGFFFTYRGGKDCTAGTSCAVNQSRRKPNKILLWISAILVIVFIFSPNILGFFVS